MGGSSFDLLMQEVHNQKQHLDELVEENQNLRHQLADLRAGQGILFEIDGQQFTLNEVSADGTQGGVVSPSQELSAYPTTMSTPLNEANMGDEGAIDTIPQSEQPEDGEFASMTSNPQQETEENAATHTTPFLEELLIDEFTSASTSPMRAWKASAAEMSSGIDEEAKAALRQELMGSFLLE